MYNNYHYSKETLTFKKLYNQLKKGVIFLPKYQRGPAWSMAQKKLLVDSILRSIDVPKIYMRKVYSIDGELSFELVDGQQRLTTLSEFVQSKFPVSSKYNPYKVHDIRGTLFHKLDEDIQDSIWDYTFDVTIYDHTTSDIFIKNMFLRMQGGKPLNAAEKRRAIDSKLVPIINDLAETHKAFTILEISSRRSKHEHLLTSVMIQINAILEKRGNNLHKDIFEFVNISTTSATALYSTFKHADSSFPINIHTVRALDTFYEVFKNTTMKIKAAQGYDYIVLCHWLNLNMPQWRKHSKEILEIIEKFESLRINYTKLDSIDHTDPLVIFTAHLRSTNKVQLKLRHNTLLNLIIHLA